MAVNEGQVNRVGVRILMKSATEPLEIPNSGGSVAYLHFVDTDNNTIVPEYEPDGLQTFAGPISGAKYMIPGTAQFLSLEQRVAALEAIVATISVAATGDTIAKRNVDGELLATNFRGDLRATSDGDTIDIKTNDNQVVMSAGKIMAVPALAFNGVPLVELPVPVSIAGGDAAIRAALVSLGLIIEVA